MLQAAQILGGNSDKMKGLSAGEVFNSLLPAVNLDIQPPPQSDPNEEILDAQGEYFSEQNEAAHNKRKLEISEKEQAVKFNASQVLGTTNSVSAQDFTGIGEHTDATDLTGFVKSFEGFLENSYDDYGQQSIGYGTKARDGETSITRDEAESRLGAELGSHRNRVLAAVKRGGHNFSDTQIDALTSFDYNTGAINHVLLKNTGTYSKPKFTNAPRFTDINQIGDKLLEYNKVTQKGKKVKSRGLAKRRGAERNIFTTGKYNR
tara:strand:+ start:6404 stop:7189 length:786 start_codon:yes stop_codon:yes gene_type:complete